TDEVRVLQTALLEVAGQARHGLAVRLEERGVRVDVRAIALPDDELGVWDLQILVHVGVRRALDAVIRPEHLGAVRELDRLERFLAGMTRGEGDVTLRVPVLRDHHVAERRCELVDQRNDLVAVGHGQRAAGEETILHVDDGEHVVVTRLDSRLRVYPARRGGHDGGGSGGGQKPASIERGHGNLPRVSTVALGVETRKAGASSLRGPWSGARRVTTR